MSTKPTLFHDIDGVLYGVYEEEFQLRPGVKPWLKWAYENFEVVWLTSWPEAKIRTLLRVVFVEKFLKDLPLMSVGCADWKHCESKAAWLAQLLDKRPDLDWYWIDDDISETELAAYGLPKERCIQVPSRGSDTLRGLRNQLTGLRAVA